MARSFSSSTDVGKNAAIPAVLNTNGGSGSISFWFKPTWSAGDSTTHQFYQISDGTVVQTTGVIGYHRNDNTFVFGSNFNNANIISFADTGIAAGTWYNVIWTFVGAGSSFIYFNGVQNGTLGSFSNDNQTLTHLSVGNNFLTPANPANSSMVDFAIWSVALTAGEISALAKGARPYMIRPANLNIFIPLDGLQSPEPDLSGMGANLTLTGTAPAAGAPIMMFTPRWRQNIPGAAAASGVVFRRSLSSVGTRTGSRQAVQ